MGKHINNLEIMIAEIDDPHPSRVHSTFCKECGERSVFFDSSMVDVICHNCRSSEKDQLQRMTHLQVWKMYNITRKDNFG